MLDKIANEIVIASQVLHTNKLGTIAENLGYQPILILNALHEAEEAGKLQFIKKKDILKISEDVEIGALSVTEAIEDSREQVEKFVAYENGRQQDITFDDLRTFIPMLPELHLKIAIETSKLLDTYEYADPKDKESFYTFVTLKENKDRIWGSKQFDESNSLAKKHAKKHAK